WSAAGCGRSSRSSSGKKPRRRVASIAQRRAANIRERRRICCMDLHNLIILRMHLFIHHGSMTLKYHGVLEQCRIDLQILTEVIEKRAPLITILKSKLEFTQIMSLTQDLFQTQPNQQDAIAFQYLIDFR
ncbi:unnamed protein product, partial [Leptidea sinapis]